jgi:hypothetical protein
VSLIPGKDGDIRAVVDGLDQVLADPTLAHHQEVS